MPLRRGVRAATPPHVVRGVPIGRPCLPLLLAGNSTRYRVVVGREDTAGEYFTIEALIRAEAYGVIRGAQR